MGVRGLLRVGLVTAMVVAAGVVVSARVPAHAVQGLEAGYWWQTQPDGAPLPPPGNVPDKGLWVSGNETSQVAIGAVRFQLGSAETSPVLTLKVHSQDPPNQVSSGTNAGQVVVLACPTTGTWKSASAGPWSARPQYDCAGAAHGSPNADGTTIAFDLHGVAADGKVDVAFVPGTGAPVLPNVPAPGAPPSPQPSGFDVTFETVALDQVRVSAASEETAPVGGADASLASPDTGATPADVSPSAPVPDFNFAATAVQPSTGTAAAAAPSVAPGGLEPQLRSVDTAAIGENHGYRALAVILLAGLLWWAWRQAVPPKSGRRTIYDGPPATA
ncbi:MAG: hypothetical protein JWP02_3461 [Acidimicrobiales bacterium]|nr:hypothetical protein [Acidimicrobiales bacterium]